MTDASNWATVATPTYIYVGIVKREEFDRIDLPVCDSANPDNPVLTKKAQDPSGCTIVFQHWYGPTPAERAAQLAAQRAVELLRAKRGVPA